MKLKQHYIGLEWKCFQKKKHSLYINSDELYMCT